MGYGQIGDGNIHIKVALPGHDNEALINKAHSLIDPFVLEYCKTKGSSLTAKLGVGQAYCEPVSQ